ncbi:hypothetical protein D3C81_1449310 [compost metagenome]
MQVHHLGIRVLLQQMVTHSMHQVGFTQANTAIKEERVIAMLGVIGDLPGSSTRQLVRLTFDESVEGERAVQVTGVLERTFDLNGALLGAGTGSRHRRGLGHGIKAVARRRLGHLVDQHRLYRRSSGFR